MAQPKKTKPAMKPKAKKKPLENVANGMNVLTVTAELLERIKELKVDVKKLQKLDKVGNKLARLQERVDKQDSIIKTLLLGLEPE